MLLSLKHTKHRARNIATLAISSLFSLSSFAHFQEIIPDRDFLNTDKRGPLSFNLRFTHPMDQGPVMEMKKPKQLKVYANGKSQDLLTRLQSNPATEKQWQFEYNVTEPGDLQFYVEPEPYWEPTEGKMIIHYAKVVVDGFSDFNGWDSSLGLPVEIEPLTRPYSLWAGNIFSGIVKKDGIAVPFAEIEVEWRNDGTVKAPTDSYTTQVIKADANGTFHYAMPKAGWWGFAALQTADYTLASPDGKQVPVELGGLIWINAKPMKTLEP